MQQEGKINMDLIQQLANEKMLAAFIEQKCAACHATTRFTCIIDWQPQGSTCAEHATWASSCC